MKIAIGNDHVAVELKNIIKEHLEERGYEVVDFGTNSTERFDYPISGYKVGCAVVCSEPYSAKLSREHNNTNIVAFGARVVGSELAKMIVDEWLDAKFEGGRHQRRIDMIAKIKETQQLEAAEA